jgi:hypothetical protein
MTLAIIFGFVCLVILFAVAVNNYLNTGSAFRRYPPPADPPIEILKETPTEIMISFETLIQMSLQDHLVTRMYPLTYFYRGKRIVIIGARRDGMCKDLDLKPLRHSCKDMSDD